MVLAGRPGVAERARAAYRCRPVEPGQSPVGSKDRGRTRDHAPVKTRTLLILAAITGVAILAAGAIQILLAR
jgi:hypothetical protein